MSDMKTTMDQLRDAIAASGRSRNSLAIETDMDPAHLVRIMQGTRGVSIENLERLCKALGYEVVLRPVVSKGKDVTR
jgi:transcriptional regulator with XRE-family HTH domain